MRVCVCSIPLTSLFSSSGDSQCILRRRASQSRLEDNPRACCLLTETEHSQKLALVRVTRACKSPQASEVRGNEELGSWHVYFFPLKDDEKGE